MSQKGPQTGGGISEVRAPVYNAGVAGRPLRGRRPHGQSLWTLTKHSIACALDSAGQWSERAQLAVLLPLPGSSDTQENLAPVRAGGWAAREVQHLIALPFRPSRMSPRARCEEGQPARGEAASSVWIPLPEL